jgi:glycosyltransferase involved in cell wall biosynthesis
LSAFVIVDPSLQSCNGHFLHYDNAVAAAARARDFKVVTLASMNVQRDLQVDFPCLPCFRYHLEKCWFHPALVMRSPLLRRWNRTLWYKAFLDDLRRIEDRVCLDSSSIVFMHTLTYHHIPPLVDWIKSLGPAARPYLYLFLRYAPTPNPFYPNHFQVLEYQKSLQYLETSGAEKRIVLCTDSDILAQHYRELTRLPIHVLPIPHTFPGASVGRESGREKTLAYLGNARSTKGFHYLPHVVRSLEGLFACGEWSAQFQSNVMFSHDTACVQAAAQLKRLPVKLYEQELSQQEYQKLLHRASIVVIPYKLDYYHAQTSGVLCEALGAGKPVVVPRGTWMARTIKGKGVGTTFFPTDRISLADAIRTAMRNLDQLSENCRHFQEEWLQQHNPNRFMETFLQCLAA